jgi:ketosteroid isomerase-like protein
MKQTLAFITLNIALPCFCFAQGKRSDVEEELLKLEKEFTQANLKNDAEKIGRFLADDWIIIQPNGAMIDKTRFLGAIKSGDLSYQMMEFDEAQVRIYGETALVIGAFTTKGKFKGQEFNTRERGTDVFVKRDGRWLCVFSQLTHYPKK